MPSLSRPLSSLSLAQSRPVFFRLLSSCPTAIPPMILVVCPQGRDWAVAFDYRAEIPHLRAACFSRFPWLGYSTVLGQGQKPERSSYRFGKLAFWLATVGFTVVQTRFWNYTT